MKYIGSAIRNWLMKIKGDTPIKTIVIAGAFLILGTIMVNSLISNIQLQYQKSDLSNQVFELTNQNKALEQKIEQSSSNQYIEEMAREKLGMVKSTEVPVKIVEKSNEDAQKKKLKPSDKMGIYMNDWYKEIESWVQDKKNG